MMIVDDDHDTEPGEPRPAAQNLTLLARQVLEAWRIGDFDGTFACFADDIVVALHLDPALLSFAGETVGKPAVRAAFTRMRQEFDYLMRRTTHLVEEGDVVRVGLEYMYRHKASGEVLSGHCRIVMLYRDGLVARIDEYHDQSMVESFMRLFGGPPQVGGNGA